MFKLYSWLIPVIFIICDLFLFLYLSYGIAMSGQDRSSIDYIYEGIMKISFIIGIVLFVRDSILDYVGDSKKRSRLLSTLLLSVPVLLIVVSFLISISRA